MWMWSSACRTAAHRHPAPWSGFVDAGSGHHLTGHLAPLLVGQDPVLGGVADGQVPHVLLRSLGPVDVLHGLVQKLLELFEGG